MIDKIFRGDFNPAKHDIIRESIPEPKLKAETLIAQTPEKPVNSASIEAQRQLAEKWQNILSNFKEVQCIPYTKNIPPNNTILTFDDGPSHENTGKILDTLKKHNIKGAIFFVEGENAKRNPMLIRRIVQEGHILGNHSYKHEDLTKLTKEELGKTLTATDKVVDDILGYDYPMVFVRPPYGYVNNDVRNYIEQNYGGRIIKWTDDSEDWKVQSEIYQKQKQRKAQARSNEPAIPKSHLETVKERVLKNIDTCRNKGGKVLLFHDVHKNTAEELDGIIEGLNDKGFKFYNILNPD